LPSHLIPFRLSMAPSPHLGDGMLELGLLSGICQLLQLSLSSLSVIIVMVLCDGKTTTTTTTRRLRSCGHSSCSSKLAQFRSASHCSYRMSDEWENVSREQRNSISGHGKKYPHVWEKVSRRLGKSFRGMAGVKAVNLCMMSVVQFFYFESCISMYCVFLVLLDAPEPSFDK
jgi:hypothetical protein